MNGYSPLFILAGNGPYDNRGCEAIVRGTAKILRIHFRDPQFVCLSHFQSEEQYRKQCLEETDDAIVHIASRRITKRNIIRSLWKPDTWKMAYQLFFNRKSYYTEMYKDMIPYFDETASVLSVGGDNYSIDYGGKPISFTTLDDIVLCNNKSLIIWGASIGPFNSVPDYERYMGDHLQKVTGIFARESATIKYLQSIGISKNVYAVADPAFVMDAVQPQERVYIEKGAIGLNLSPLMARFITGGDMEQWTKIAAAIIAKVADRTEGQVYLIPHVTSPHSNDYTFMQRALYLISEDNKDVVLVPPIYNAAETKWIISKMAVFAGARTHSTIAAISSGVPTLSFSYSMKARGINRDIFGHSDYCLEPIDMNAEVVSNQITSILNETTTINKGLTERIPIFQKAAMRAGVQLKQLMDAYIQEVR